MTNTEIIKNYFDALAKGDVEKAFSFFSVDVKWHQPGNNQYSGTKNGTSEIGAMIGQMMATTQGSFSVKPINNSMSNKDFVLVPVHFSGEKDEKKPLNMNGIDMFEVKNEKITQVWLFSDDQQTEDEFWE